MEQSRMFSASTLGKDLSAGLVVFLVALPLCLGIALASNAPLFSGILAGIVGGIVVGTISGSQCSVSGPAAGLTVIVAAQIAGLKSFDTFLLAVVIGGLIQIAAGVLRAGFLSAFVPSSVIKGLLAAIGVILILKQIPHVLGHDTDPEGDMAFTQPDEHNTLTEILTLFNGEIHVGALCIGILSIALLILWDKVKALKHSMVPAPLLVVLLGVTLAQLFKRLGSPWWIEESHLVQVPVAESVFGAIQFLQFPNFSQWTNPAVYTSGLTIALVASLETLLNLEAVDKLDPKHRNSPSSRELFAQGVGNVTSGLIGGIPVTSVIVRSSVNIHAGAATKLSAIFHGILLLVCVMFLPTYLNMIPLACLAAILLVTGLKLASPELMRQMWSEGRYQFIPFIVTLVSIVLTDLIVGIAIGLAVSITFILNSNLRRPIRKVIEDHLGGKVTHIELANQVSFLNRAALDRVFNELPRGSQLLLDARSTDYIDPDILSLIREFKDKTSPIRGIQVSLIGFREKYRLQDEIQYVDYSTRDLQGRISPAQVLELLVEGNERFATGHCLSRNLDRRLDASARSQHPLAIVLSCIDSRSPAELVFDLGLADIFSIRLAGNIASQEVLGSMEYGCAMAGAKLIVVLGHTRCGALTAAVKMRRFDGEPVTGEECQHLRTIVANLQPSFDGDASQAIDELSEEHLTRSVDAIAQRNVRATVEQIVTRSHVLQRLASDGKIAVVGAMYDVDSRKVQFFSDQAIGLTVGESLETSSP